MDMPHPDLANVEGTGPGSVDVERLAAEVPATCLTSPNHTWEFGVPDLPPIVMLTIRLENVVRLMSGSDLAYSN
jgi:hypothetical protein